MLVVDDSDFFAEMTAQTLANEHGFETASETNVADALDRLGQKAYDCIVSDYQMPGRDGLEFLRVVRDRLDDIPFILLTGRGDEAIASEAIAMGVADYLLKLEVVEDQQYGRLANRIESVVDRYDTKRKYELLVTNTPDAIAQVTVEGTVVAANAGLGDALGTDPDTLVGQSLADVMPDGVASERLEVGRRVVENGETETLEDSLRPRRCTRCRRQFPDDLAGHHRTQGPGATARTAKRTPPAVRQRRQPRPPEPPDGGTERGRTARR